MLHSDINYTKLRWFLTIAGLLLYVVDIWTDVFLALKYYDQKNFSWMGLTLVFVLAGLLVTQIFSYAWYRDDMQDALVNSEGQSTISGMSKSALAIVHVFGMGIFNRHFHLLTKGFAVIWMTTACTPEEQRSLHQSLFGLATDLSMLKMFETFLESVPQLLLQLYIMLCHDETSVMQCVSMAFSFFNTAWVLVDYRRCLGRSLPHIKELPSGLPTLVYLLYKLCTITSHILSCCLLLILSSYSSVGLAILWLLGTTWTHLLHTDFCSSKRLEWLYRAVIGLILVFTFFNVKGQDTKVAMSIYYSFYTVVNVAAPILGLLMPLETSQFLLPICGVIFGGTLLGLVSLVVYYVLLHPTGRSREADEVDGLGQEAGATLRINRFLQP